MHAGEHTMMHCWFTSNSMFMTHVMHPHNQGGAASCFHAFRFDSQGCSPRRVCQESARRSDGLGISIRRILADRWFASLGLLEWRQARDIEYVGPYKKQKNVIPFIHAYLKAGKDIVFSFLIQGDPTRFN